LLGSRFGNKFVKKFLISLNWLILKY